MVKHTAVTLVLTCCTVAMAVGDNTHPQGVRYAGPGLDEQTAMQKPQWVPWFKNDKDWPPPDGKYESDDGPKRLLIQVTCPKAQGDPIFALCSGVVREIAKDGSIANTAACGRGASDEPFPLLAIRGKLDAKDGEFKQDNKVVTFACAPKFEKPEITTLSNFDPAKHQPDDHPSDLDDEKTHHLGVMAKCYFWGFGEAKKLRTYQACLRAARAEYCGGGISYTESGTLIHVYEPNETTVGKPIKVVQIPTRCAMVNRRFGFDPCFEAIWDEKGAICVSHSRWENMPAPECSKDAFKHPSRVHGGFARETYAHPTSDFKPPLSPEPALDGGVAPSAGPTPHAHCRNSDYQIHVVKSRIKNRSGINSPSGLRGCRNDIPCP